MIHNPLQDKNIILGVTGSIAAYKGADLASKLAQNGANVDVILTNSALQFITPLTFQSVTGRQAYTDADLWGSQGHVKHIALGHYANLFIIAPITANTMAKLANGIGDNLLTVSALATHCPIIIAPAMDAGMFNHPATQANLQTLKARNVHIIGPVSGHLASGLEGLGRFVEPLHILGKARYILSRGGPLAGKHIVITAGGTQEPIDPVRLITNRSSGKQGYAIAQAAIDSGADVTLISAPTTLSAPTGANLITVRTAREMLKEVEATVSSADALIMAAAVADFTPSVQATEKIKKDSGYTNIPLERTVDILASIGEYKQHVGKKLITIGFAAESENLINNATKKLHEKHVELIVANDISATDAGFEVDTNRVTFLYADGEIEKYPLLSKFEVAAQVIEALVKMFQNLSV